MIQKKNYSKEMKNKYKKIFIVLVIALLIVDAFVINIVGGRGSLIVSISFITYIIIFETFKPKKKDWVFQSLINLVQSWFYPSESGCTAIKTPVASP